MLEFAEDVGRCCNRVLQMSSPNSGKQEKKPGGLRKYHVLRKGLDS